MIYDKRSYYYYRRHQRRRSGAAYVWLVVCLLMIGTVSLLNGLADQKTLAATENSGELPDIRTAQTIPAVSSTPASTPASDPTIGPGSLFLPFSQPTSIEVPSVQIKSDLVTVGKAPDGSMEVPEGANFDKAAWYKHSPAPGQYGSSVIVGHVDSIASNGASVFFNLAKLKPGERVNVKRADQTTASFSVIAVRDYGKTGMPADVVYKPVADTAELRLITCSGRFDEATQSYENVTVIFATMIP